MAANKKQAGVLIVLMMASGVVWLIGNLPETKRGGVKPGRTVDLTCSRTVT
ncbi:MAG: hypothetical protein ABGZ49_13900 [Akkermansiaceae bacterium]